MKFFTFCVFIFFAFSIQQAYAGAKELIVSKPVALTAEPFTDYDGKRNYQYGFRQSEIQPLDGYGHRFLEITHHSLLIPATETYGGGASDVAVWQLDSENPMRKPKRLAAFVATGGEGEGFYAPGDELDRRHPLLITQQDGGPGLDIMRVYNLLTGKLLFQTAGVKTFLWKQSESDKAAIWVAFDRQADTANTKGKNYLGKLSMGNAKGMLDALDVYMKDWPEDDLMTWVETPELCWQEMCYGELTQQDRFRLSQGPAMPPRLSKQEGPVVQMVSVQAQSEELSKLLMFPDGHPPAEGTPYQAHYSQKTYANIPVNHDRFDMERINADLTPGFPLTFKRP